jgi:very-short-patch-repair endonuclease
MKIVNNISALFYCRKELRNNATLEETLLWSKLKHSQLGLKFRRQHSIGGYIVDFYCPAKRLVIEIDGSQHFRKESKEYDDIRTQFFKGLNIKVIRFNNAEISANLDEVLQKIITQLTVSPPCGGGD